MMAKRAKLKPPSLEALQREMVILANGLEYNPQVYALRLAINRVLDAYQKESTQAFGLGLLGGAFAMAVLLLGGGGASYG